MFFLKKIFITLILIFSISNLTTADDNNNGHQINFFTGKKKFKLIFLSDDLRNSKLFSEIAVTLKSFFLDFEFSIIRSISNPFSLKTSADIRPVKPPPTMHILCFFILMVKSK